jgi:hypothetical protein
VFIIVSQAFTRLIDTGQFVQWDVKFYACPHGRIKIDGSLRGGIVIEVQCLLADGWILARNILQRNSFFINGQDGIAGLLDFWNHNVSLRDKTLLVDILQFRIRGTQIAQTHVIQFR